MNQCAKNYSRLSSPVERSPKRKNEETRYLCSVTYQSDRVTSNFRMVAVAIMMLFAFCVLLFVWNIVLWRDLVRLQNDFTTLRREKEEASSVEHTKCDVIVASPADEHRQHVDDNTHEEKLEKGNLLVKEEIPKHLLKREKRNALEDVNNLRLLVEVAVDRDSSLLSRIRRSPRRDSDGSDASADRKKNKRKGNRGKKRKDRQGGRRMLQKATAFHVKIQGSIPYQGRTVNDREGVIRHWDGSTALSQGFDIANLNSQGIRILKEGLYFIYSQVTFKIGSGIEVHEKIMAGTTYTSELASCSNPVPHTNTSEYITCYSSGIKRLSADDKIHVKVYPTNMVVFNNPSYTYFGAFLLGA